MKKPYTKPVFSCEQFEVNQDIASGCQIILNFGGGGWNRKKNCWDNICQDYIDMFGFEGVTAANSNGISPSCIPFSEGLCDCYLAAVGDAIFTS